MGGEKKIFIFGCCVYSIDLPNIWPTIVIITNPTIIKDTIGTKSILFYLAVFFDNILMFAMYSYDYWSIYFLWKNSVKGKSHNIILAWSIIMRILFIALIVFRISNYLFKKMNNDESRVILLEHLVLLYHH